MEQSQGQGRALCLPAGPFLLLCEDPGVDVTAQSPEHGRPHALPYWEGPDSISHCALRQAEQSPSEPALGFRVWPVACGLCVNLGRSPLPSGPFPGSGMGWLAAGWGQGDGDMAPGPHQRAAGQGCEPHRLSDPTLGTLSTQGFRGTLASPHQPLHPSKSSPHQGRAFIQQTSRLPVFSAIRHRCWRPCSAGPACMPAAHQDRAGDRQL